MEDKIELFKNKVINFALEYIDNNGEYANIRELKDLTTMIDIIEKSYKKDEPITNNITQTFTKIIAKFETDINRSDFQKELTYNG